jgi:hypothetical protein
MLIFRGILLFFILWGGVLFPLICTFVIWHKEQRLVLFSIDTNLSRSTPLEVQLWAYRKRFVRISMLCTAAFAASIIFE